MKMEKVEKMDEIIAILEKIIVTIPSRPYSPLGGVCLSRSRSQLSKSDEVAPGTLSTVGRLELSSQH